MKSRKYRFETSCPQCGAEDIENLSAEEIKEKYGDTDNIELECSECLAKFDITMESVCYEWDKVCKMREYLS